MALSRGASVPEFEMAGSDGRVWRAADLRGRAYVLTFYPHDETMGCIKQVCSFRDAWEGFEQSGVLVFGVSRDSVESHQAFVKNRRLPYTLLTDATGEWHKAFDIGRLFGVNRRVSYLVDGDGRVADAFSANMRPAVHAERMLKSARALRPSEHAAQA